MKYLPFECRLVFEVPVCFNVNPLFVVRSMLGASLRHVACPDLEARCPECGRRDSCVYNVLFEGIPAKGQERGMKVHPYLVKIAEEPSVTRERRSFSFRMVLVGEDAMGLYPYIYLALSNAGRRGILKARIPFSFEVVSAGKDGSGNVNLAGAVCDWNEDDEGYKPFSGQVCINILTPLRFQYGGHYGMDFSAWDLFSCLERRMLAMTATYGGGCGQSGRNGLDIGFKISQKRLRWIDSNHYSARQKESMKLGGVMGSIILEGDFSSYDMKVLDFAEKFSAGKNVAFGLGDIELWKKETS